MSDTIALEVAEAEFARFVDLMAIDVDESKMSEETLEGFNTQKGRIVRAICNGHLTINDDGEPTFTPQRVKEQSAITFFEPTGASLMAMDRKKQNEGVGKMFSTMADMTKTSPKTFSKMKVPDLNVCLAITSLFLG